MRIYLVGYMYSGKTTLGRALAKRMGYNFIDTDQLFEERYHTHITLFFQKYGEAAFRVLETQMLHSTADLDNVVVSTGGGTPCHADNMDFILAHGTAIYLQMEVDALAQRALRSHNPRPLIQGLTPDEVRSKIAQQLKERERYYLRAPIILDGTCPKL